MLRVAETIVRTDTGRHRTGNEDASLAISPLFVLADGMGGAQSGEVASGIAIDAFLEGLPDDGSPEQRLVDVVRRANLEIHRRSISEAENAGMGTTLTAAYLDADAVAIAHVGDSRAYLVRDGELRRLTQDHSLVEELLRDGKLTEQQALAHPQRSIITRALGPDPDVQVDTWSYSLRDGDVVLLCSDGLTDMLAEHEVRDLIVDAADLPSAADRLIEHANAAGGRDNITVVLFRVATAPDGEAVQGGGEGGGTDAGTAGPQTEVWVGGELKASSEADASPADPVAPRPSGASVRRAPLARIQGRRVPGSGRRSGTDERQPGRLGKLAAATLALLAVILLVGGGGYLATRQLYFLGTNDQGMVVVYRGLPYRLPLGVPLYETFYVSGVPAQTVPAHRRATLLNHSIRGQTGATKLINDLELGKIAG